MCEERNLLAHDPARAQRSGSRAATRAFERARAITRAPRRHSGGPCALRCLRALGFELFLVAVECAQVLVQLASCCEVHDETIPCCETGNADLSDVSPGTKDLS